jgi:peptide/nickel transport system permease protein
MLLFTIKRLLLLIPVFLAISVVIFMLVHLVPGDPIDNIIRIGATPAEKAAMVARLGLDQPLWWQYTTWLGKLFQGDLGDAIILRRPVADLIALNLPHSLALGSLALLFYTVVGITTGAPCHRRGPSGASGALQKTPSPISSSGAWAR